MKCGETFFVADRSFTKLSLLNFGEKELLLGGLHEQSTYSSDMKNPVKGKESLS